MKWFGHVVRNDGIPKVRGFVEGRRRRGGEKMTWGSNVKRWTGRSLGELSGGGRSGPMAEVRLQKSLIKIVLPTTGLSGTASAPQNYDNLSRFTGSSDTPYSHAVCVCVHVCVLACV